MDASKAKTFAVGSVAENSSVIYLQQSHGKKAIINYLHLSRKSNTNLLRLNLSVTINGVTARFLPVNMMIDTDTYVLDILEDNQTITLKQGDYISASCNVPNSLDYILSGELHEDL